MCLSLRVWHNKKNVVTSKEIRKCSVRELHFCLRDITRNKNNVIHSLSFRWYSNRNLSLTSRKFLACAARDDSSIRYTSKVSRLHTVILKLKFLQNQEDRCRATRTQCASGRENIRDCIPSRCVVICWEYGEHVARSSREWVGDGENARG